MYYYERKYNAGRAVLTVAEFLNWVFVFIGAILVISGFSMGQSFGGSVFYGFVGSIFGLVVVVLSLIGVCVVQSGKAQIDTTEMTRDMLSLQREHYRALGRPGGAQQFGDLNPSPSPSMPTTPPPSIASSPMAPVAKPRSLVNGDPPRPPQGQQVLVQTYKDRDIHRRHEGFYVGEKWFMSSERARAFIDTEAPKSAETSDDSYKGVAIRKDGNGYFVGERQFLSYALACAFVDKSIG